MKTYTNNFIIFIPIHINPLADLVRFIRSLLIVLLPNYAVEITNNSLIDLVEAAKNFHNTYDDDDDKTLSKTCTRLRSIIILNHSFEPNKIFCMSTKAWLRLL